MPWKCTAVNVCERRRALKQVNGRLQESSEAARRRLTPRRSETTDGGPKSASNGQTGTVALTDGIAEEEQSARQEWGEHSHDYMNFRGSSGAFPLDFEGIEAKG